MKADTTARFFGRGVLLAAAAVEPAVAEENTPVWLQIAKEGKYKGHPDFPEVDFSRTVFSKVVENFHAHPAYKADASGVGSEPVVPFDYEHASELDPTSGSVPQKGAPSPAWVLELDVRDGADGTAELWALTRLGKQAREQIKAEEYKWTSVAVWRNATDPVTGDEIGPVLTSVAFTNHPFIQGMQALAASSKGERIQAKADVWGKAESPEEAIIGLRQIFGLDPLSDANAIQEQLDRFAAFVSAGPWPNGVDGDYMLRRLRELFGLPALATWDEISGAAGGFLSGLVSNGAGLADASAEGTAGATQMKFTSAQLADLLKCRDNDDAILAAAKTAAAAQDAIDKLKALFGSGDTQSVMADAAALATKVKENEGLLSALSALVAGLGSGTKSETPEAEIEGEAAAAMASITAATETQRQWLKPIIKLAIVAVREHAIANQEAEAVIASLATAHGKDHGERMRPIVFDQRRAAIGNPNQLAKFRAAFPLPDAQRELLTRAIFAGPNGVQMGGAQTGLPPVPPTAPIVNQQQAPQQQPGQLPTHLMAMPGPNATEKARQYLCAKLPGFKDSDSMHQNFQAGEYLRNGAPAL